MTTVAAFLHACRAELGYQEQPSGSNMTKYAAMTWHANGYPWCCTFLCAMAKQAGLELPAGVEGSAYTWTQLGAWRNADLADAHPVVGAWAYFEIGAGHVGVVESFTDATVTTIDGNTVPDGKTGDQANGGEVARKTRSRALVAGYGLPIYDPPGSDEAMRTHVVTVEGLGWQAARPDLNGVELDPIRMADVVEWRGLAEASGKGTVGIEGWLYLEAPGKYMVVTHS